MQDMKESVSQVLKITITERNLPSWSKSVSERLQEGVYTFHRDL